MALEPTDKSGTPIQGDPEQVEEFYLNGGKVRVFVKEPWKVWHVARVNGAALGSVEKTGESYSPVGASVLGGSLPGTAQSTLLDALPHLLAGE